MEGVSEEKKSRIKALCHAVQTGVAYNMEHSLPGSRETDPKHLRVGVNVGMCDHGALVALLIKKGVITADEYADEDITMLEREVADYEAMLTGRLGTEVSLS